MACVWTRTFSNERQLNVGIFSPRLVDPSRNDIKRLDADSRLSVLSFHSRRNVRRAFSFSLIHIWQRTTWKRVYQLVSTRILRRLASLLQTEVRKSLIYNINGKCLQAIEIDLFENNRDEITQREKRSLIERIGVVRASRSCLKLKPMKLVRIWCCEKRVDQEKSLFSEHMCTLQR